LIDVEKGILEAVVVKFVLDRGSNDAAESSGGVA
jgi:hypothetical protein